MSPAHVLEPTYLAVKRRLMQGYWPAGFHLDTTRLAEDLDVSTSPIRDSLNRLAGERMVDFEPGAGFQVPRFDEKQLHDLLEVSCCLAVAAVHRLVYPAALVAASGSPEAAHRFLQLAQATGNGELAGAVSHINDHLAAVRLLDATVLREPDSELQALERAIDERDDASNLVSILARYHARRQRHARDDVRLLEMGIRRDATGRPTGS